MAPELIVSRVFGGLEQAVVTIGLPGTLFGGLGRVIGRVKHWLWQLMDIDKSRNAEIGAEGHEGEHPGMLKSAVIQTALAGEAIVNAVIGRVGGTEHEQGHQEEGGALEVAAADGKDDSAQQRENQGTGATVTPTTKGGEARPSGDAGVAGPTPSGGKDPAIPITDPSAKAQATQELKKGGIPGIGKPGSGKGPTQGTGEAPTEAGGEGRTPLTGKDPAIPITDPKAKETAAREAEQGGTAIKPLEKKPSGSEKGGFAALRADMMKRSDSNPSSRKEGGGGMGQRMKDAARNMEGRLGLNRQKSGDKAQGVAKKDEATDQATGKDEGPGMGQKIKEAGQSIEDKAKDLVKKGEEAVGMGEKQGEKGEGDITAQGGERPAEPTTKPSTEAAVHDEGVKKPPPLASVGAARGPGLHELHDKTQGEPAQVGPDITRQHSKLSHQKQVKCVLS